MTWEKERYLVMLYLIKRSIACWEDCIEKFYGRGHCGTARSIFPRKGKNPFFMHLRASEHTASMLRIAVIDGQGGGIGSLMVKRLKEEFSDKIEVIALGTNAAATTAMMKSRANKGATGENAIIWNSAKVDMIVGPLSIVFPNAMLGEVTAGMASAIVASSAEKLLLPLNQEGVEIAGGNKEPLPHLIEHVISRIKENCHV
jgi:hypothetical protein